MTREDVEMIIKRYGYIVPQIKEKSCVAVYYIGNRKFSTPITEPVITVCQIIDEINSHIADAWIKRMIEGILSVKSDVSLMMNLPCSKNTYYKFKGKFISTVYDCCIAKGLISYEEILEHTKL